MRFPRKRGATSVKVRVFIPDNSVTNGAGLSSLLFSSTNLAICYSRENDNGGTEVTGANLLDITTIGTWADPGAGNLRIKAVDATRLPGLYEIQFPDAAAFGTGDASQNLVINVYEKTMTALHIGPNMVMIPLSALTVLDGEANAIQVNGTAQTARDLGANLDVAVSTRTKPADTQARVTLVDTVTTYTGNTPQTGDTFARIGAAGAGLTALGDTRIAHLDADVSSRSTYAGGDTSGTTTLLSRIASALTITGGKVDVNDKTGFSLSTAGILAIWHQLTAAIVTAGTIGKLLVDNIDAAISSRSTYAGGAVASVTAPVTAGTVTDKTGYALTAAYDPAKTAAQAGDAMALTSGERTTLVADVWAAAGRTLTSFGTLVADAATAVWGAVTRSLTDKAGFSLASAYDAAKTAGDATAANQTTINANVLTRLATSGYTAPDNAGIASIESAVTALPTANANADALLDRTAGVETGWTIRQTLRIILGVLAGKTTGANTTSMAFRDTADTKNRVAVTLDSNGNRTAVSTDAS